MWSKLAYTGLVLGALAFVYFVTICSASVIAEGKKQFNISKELDKQAGRVFLFSIVMIVSSIFIFIWS